MAKANLKLQTCIICGVKKKEYEVNSHRNESLAEEFCFCKDCVNTLSKSDEGMVQVMRMMNIPFVNAIWESCKKDSPVNPLGTYLKTIPMKKMYKDFVDSEFDKEVKTSNIVITDEVISRWGNGSEWDEEKYLDYEMALDDLKRIKMPMTALEEKRYIENVRLGKRLQQEIEGGKAGDIKALKLTYSQDLKELGLDLESASKEDSRTLGTRIRDWERNEPLPTISIEFEDVDRVKKYIDKYFVIPMKRVFNLASDDEIQSLYDIDPTLDPSKKKG